MITEGYKSHHLLPMRIDQDSSHIIITPANYNTNTTQTNFPTNVSIVWKSRSFPILPTPRHSISAQCRLVRPLHVVLSQPADMDQRKKFPLPQLRLLSGGSYPRSTLAPGDCQKS